jgi:DME family drug/metabolite transporter
MSGIVFAAQTLINRRAVNGLRPRTLVALSFTIAGVLCIPWAAANGFALGTMTPIAWTSLGLLSFGSTLLGFLFYYAGLHRGIHPTTAAVPVALETVIAGILAILVLGEHLSVLATAGMVLIVAGVLLARPRVQKNSMPATLGPTLLASAPASTDDA